MEAMLTSHQFVPLAMRSPSSSETLALSERVTLAVAVVDAAKVAVAAAAVGVDTETVAGAAAGSLDKDAAAASAVETDTAGTAVSAVAGTVAVADFGVAAAVAGAHVARQQLRR